MGLDKLNGGGIGYESLGASVRVTAYPSLRRYAYTFHCVSKVKIQLRLFIPETFRESCSPFPASQCMLAGRSSEHQQSLQTLADETRLHHTPSNKRVLLFLQDKWLLLGEVQAFCVFLLLHFCRGLAEEQNVPCSRNGFRGGQ